MEGEPLNSLFTQCARLICPYTPKLGQHTEEVLGGLGYSQSDIDRWRADGSIR